VFLQTLLLLGLTSAVAGLIYYDVEKAYRKSFLESALLAELVSRDSLSGLMNRRAFDEHLMRIWKQGLRDQRVVAILMIDLDHFKQFNDSFGHQAGDRAIRAAGLVLQAFARRPLDMAARYGGEEFVMILYDLQPEHVRDMAEKLRESIGSMHRVTGVEQRCTASVGVALGLPALGRSPDGLLHVADEALYQAKREGRDRVVIRGVQECLSATTGRFAARNALRA
jgi:diguanylate cyclase (GGDEF)-like protein